MNLFLYTLFIILGLELLLRKLDDRMTATKHHGLTHYAWSFVTPKGEAISHLKGELKLCAHPFTVYTNAPYQKGSRFTTNERGMRTDPDMSFRNLLKGQRRILVLGGSTAFGAGLDSNDETFCGPSFRDA